MTGPLSKSKSHGTSLSSTDLPGIDKNRRHESIIIKFVKMQLIIMNQTKELIENRRQNITENGHPHKLTGGYLTTRNFN